MVYKKNIMYKFISSVLIFLISNIYVFSQDQKRIYLEDAGLIPEEHVLDIKHLKLEVNFDVEKGLVMGKATHTFRPKRMEVDSFFFHAVDIKFEKIKIGGKKVEFRTDKNGVHIFSKEKMSWDKDYEVEIEYQAQPKKGLYFIGWSDPNKISRKQIWTQGQGIDNRHWIPCYDAINDKYTTEIIVEFDEKYKVLSNGALQSVQTEKKGKMKWHYKMTKPHASYLIMLAIGDYKIKTTNAKNGVKMSLYYYPEWENRVDATYKYSEDIMDFLVEEIGIAYPWASYSQVPVQDFMYGAMENTTATIFGDFLFVDERSYLDRNYVRVNAHELAHQWFGDLVTARSGAHHWLQESFATYYDGLYQKRAFGEDSYSFVRRNAAIAAIAESKKNLRPIAHSEAGSVRHYPKGAIVLDMLRYVVGDEHFKKAIQHYLTKHAFQNVDSDDLLVAFQESLGMSLNWFWEQWVYKGGEPFYRVNFDIVNQPKGESYTAFSVEQIQDLADDLVSIFKMPIQFQVVYKDGTNDTETHWIDKKYQTIRIANKKNKEVDFVLFDVDSRIIKSVEINKPYEMLLSQANKAVSVLDRFDAVAAISKSDNKNKDNDLFKIFETEKNPKIKELIVSELINNSDFKKIVPLAINDKNHEVRRSAISNAQYFEEKQLNEWTKLLADSSYITVELTLTKLSEYFPNKRKDFLKITENTKGTNGLNVLIKHLEIESEFDKEKINELKKYCSNSYEFITRVNAMNALKRLGFLDEELLGYLLNAGFSSNSRLANPAFEVINYFAQQSKYKSMILNYISKTKFSDFERQKLNRLVI
jgi:aminopeptidase N